MLNGPNSNHEIMRMIHDFRIHSIEAATELDLTWSAVSIQDQ
jgi:hypothetical protein